MAKAKKKPAGSKSGEATEFPADVAKNIWLAGLGAYGKAYDEAVARYEKASKDTPKLFKDLVKKGEKLEEETRETVSDNKLTKARDDIRADIEERIQAVKDNLGFGNLFGTQGETDLGRIEEKLDALTRKVDALAKALDVKPEPASKTRAKKKPAPKSKARSKAKAAPKTKSKATARRKKA